MEIVIYSKMVIYEKNLYNSENEGGILWTAKAQYGSMVQSSINLKVLFKPATRQMFIIFLFAQGNETRVY